MNRKLAYGGQLVLQIILLTGILAAVNYLSQYHFVRLDLTQNREYTISAASRNIVGEIKDILHIKAFFSHNLPPYMINLERQVRDMLDEYRAYSGGKIEIEFYDPDADSRLEQQAQQMGIPKVQLNIIEKDKAQMRPAFLGLVLLYEDKKQAIPMVTDTANLEYELSAAIHKLTTRKLKTIGWLTGHGERNAAKEYAALQRELEKQYQVTNVEITDSGISSGISTLLVAQPGRLGDQDKYALDQYVMRGGKLFFLLDSVKLQRRTMASMTVDSGVGDMLTHYGIGLKSNLVLDKVNVNATFTTEFLQFTTPYPYWVKVVKSGLAAGHPGLEPVNHVVFPWTGSLELVPKNLAGKEVIKLASTSAHAWEVTGPLYDLNPQQQFEPLNPKPHLLAAAVSGQFRSFYQTRPAAENDMLQSGAAAPPYAPHIALGLPAHLVVVSNSRFIMDEFVRDFPNNLVFMLNLADWLNTGPELIKLRSRQIADRSLKDVSEETKGYIKFANTFGAAGLVILFGLIRWLLKRRGLTSL